MRPIIDTHCHLDFDQFIGDLDSVYDRNRLNAIGAVILIGTTPQSWQKTTEIASRRQNTWRAAGIHPNAVQDVWNQSVESELRNELQNPGIVAVGETGLDLFRSEQSLDDQVRAFERHLELSDEFELPVVIHQRNAEAEVMDVLSDFAPVSGVMHCFSGDWSFAERCIEVGLHLGIGGIATYPSAGNVRDAISQIPVDRLVLETDAPFLAPQAKRGKRNEPSFLRLTLSVVAETMKISENEAADRTTDNAISLFGLELESP